MLDFYYIAEMRDGGEKSGRLTAPNPQTVYEIAKLRHKQATRIHVIPPMAMEVPDQQTPESAEPPKKKFPLRGGYFLLEEDIISAGSLKLMVDVGLFAGVAVFVFYLLLN